MAVAKKTAADSSKKKSGGKEQLHTEGPISEKDEVKKAEHEMMKRLKNKK